MNTKSIGDISEAFCAAIFLSRGYTVLKPMGDNSRYDLVIDRGNGFERVQVKTAKYSEEEGCLRIPMCSTSYNGVEHKDYQGDADLIAAWSEHTRKVYLLPLSEFTSSRESRLRVLPAKNSQKARVKEASQYEV